MVLICPTLCESESNAVAAQQSNNPIPAHKALTDSSLSTGRLTKCRAETVQALARHCPGRNKHTDRSQASPPMSHDYVMRGNTEKLPASAKKATAGEAGLKQHTSTRARPCHRTRSTTPCTPESQAIYGDSSKCGGQHKTCAWQCHLLNVNGGACDNRSGPYLKWGLPFQATWTSKRLLKNGTTGKAVLCCDMYRYIREYLQMYFWRVDTSGLKLKIWSHFPKRAFGWVK